MSMGRLRRKLDAIEARLPRREVRVNGPEMVRGDPEVIVAEGQLALALDAWEGQADRFGRRPEAVRRALLDATRRASEARNAALARMLPGLERPGVELIVIRRRHRPIESGIGDD